MTDSYINWHGFRALPNNLPVRRPGVYLITCLINSKVYVGISQNLHKRLLAHAAGVSPRRLKSAIKSHGRSAFLIYPILISFDGTDYLPFVEADLIVDYDAIRNGYNIQAASGTVGPYGAAYSAALKKAFARPDRIARRREINADPEYQARKGRAISAALAVPEEKARRAEQMRRIMADEILGARRRAAAMAGLNRPDVKLKRSEIAKGRMWATNGENCIRIRSLADLPVGWRLGRRFRYKGAIRSGRQGRFLF